MLGCCCVCLSSFFCLHSILYGQHRQWDGSVPHAPLSRSLLSATLPLPRSEELSKQAKHIYIYKWETLNHSTDFKISIKSDFFMLKNPQVFLYTNLNLDLSLFYVFIYLFWTWYYGNATFLGVPWKYNRIVLNQFISNSNNISKYFDFYCIYHNRWLSKTFKWTPNL